MKLYFHPLSGNSRRVLLAAAQLQAPLERIVVDITQGEQRGPAHLGRNPNGKVPVLEDGDLMLWESRAIMQYLAELTPGQTVYPSEPRARADVNRWMFWCAAHMAPANTILVFENFVKPRTGRQADPVEVARGQALNAECSALLDAHLDGKTWVSQDRLTLADLSIAAAFALAVPAGIPLAPYPHLSAWLGRVQALDAWRETQPQLPR